MAHLDRHALEAGLEEILTSPRDEGVLRMIVARPRNGAREVLEEGRLDLAEGLVGDNWLARGSRNGPAEPDAQLNIMNARVIALLAGSRDRWPLAGDQLYVDLDLSTSNLPPGMRLSLGSSIIEITAKPHTGCKKFVQRFGLDAMRFVNSPLGRRLNLRGACARVLKPGTVRVGDQVRKLTGDTAPAS